MVSYLLYLLEKLFDGLYDDRMRPQRPTLEEVVIGINHGVLYYRPRQRASDFWNKAWEAFDVLNILNMVIY